MSAELISKARKSFEEFVTNSPPSVLAPEDHRFFADYIRSWLQSGNGVRICQGSFEKFLIASIALIHWWQQEPGWTDYLPEIELPNGDLEPDVPNQVRRRIEVALRPGAQHEILDRDFFDTCAFNTLHGEA